MNVAQPQQFVAYPPQSQYVTSIGQPQRYGQNVQGYFSPAKRRGLKGMSIFQIVMGGLAVLLGLIVVIITPFHISANGDIGTGMWVGGFIIATGIVGVIAAWKNGFGTVVACMVLNIICTLMAFVLIVTSAISISANNYGCSYNRRYNDHDPCSPAVMAMDALSLIIALSQFVITIICSALCCGAMCCETQTPASYLPGVVYQVNQPANAAPMINMQYAGAPQPSYAVADQGYVNQGVFHTQGQVPHQNLQPNMQVTPPPQKYEGEAPPGYHTTVNQ